MIVVTGGAGFIGSNLVKGLNQKGYTDIIVIDDLKQGEKFKNLVDCEIYDYLEKDDFLLKLAKKDYLGTTIEAFFHLGACSSTTEWDGQYMMQNNYEYSKTVLHYCLSRHIPFLYASSASVYGGGNVFQEDREYEAPLNVYGYSKFLFDQYVRRHLSISTSQIIGFRYFNVYGPREQHKGSMASVAFHLNRQIQETGVIKLFEGSDGYDNGEQRRDFIYIDDVIAINLWFLIDQPRRSGIFNVGTGKSQTFNDIAKAVLKWYGKGELQYIPFPEHLKGYYQSFTEANIMALQETGYNKPFDTVESGVKKYLDWLAQHPGI